MAGPIGFLLGGDGWAANAGLGLISHGQPQKKRKLPCESSVAGLTGKAEDFKKDSKHNNTSASAAASSSGASSAAPSATGGKKKRRKTKWNVEPGLSIVRNAIYMYRNGVCNSVQIERLLQVPARTLRRYVNESMDPTCTLFYMPETPHERRGRELQEAGQRHGLYSHKSFEAVMRYARQPNNSTSSTTQAEAVAAAAPAMAAQHAVNAAATAAAATASAAAATAAAAPQLPRAPSLTFALSPATGASPRLPASQHSLFDPQDQQPGIAKAHSLANPQPSTGKGGSSNAFDLEGTMDVLQQLGVTSSASSASASGGDDDFDDLDLGILDFFSDGSSQLHSSLSPASSINATSGDRVRYNLSLGDDVCSQIVALPLPDGVGAQGAQPIIDSSAATESPQKLGGQQQLQLVQPLSFW